ncbi:phosphate/phosphite/phosphonate ABC transporter substrate-binding protein [Bacillus fonticola]|uniref:phosphate/phosphite/phosphonate ABC transporter substrate-binding protein n=1 Tax=Bacillus fonticola TaxID=2728853 RepID=UPI00147352C7|nr:phosphate/phosphite/phosphonate ABC transporter substrate-binding protein [Bacillus fonticola]
MKKFISTMLVLVLAFTLAACGSSSGSEEEGRPEVLKIGFVPSQDSDTIADTVQPLADKLGEELGMEVEASVMTDYNALIEGMGSNNIHLGFIPAFGYVLASQEYDVNVILKSIRFGSDTYKAQYLVRSDSGIESLEDLKGKRWAYADATSTSGFLFPAAQLMEEFDLADTNELTTEFFSEAIQVGGHDTAAVEVYEGGADVATTFDDVRTQLEEEYPDIMEQLTVLDYTAEIPNDTISVTKELDPEFVQEIKDVFLSFNEDKEMIEIMNEVYNWDAIAEASDEEYQVVRDTYERFRDSITLDSL